MRIVISGGTGFIGSALTDHFRQANHEVVLLTRRPSAAAGRAHPSIKVLEWDGKTVGDWGAALDGADAVLNFAGESIGEKRWSAKRKRMIVESRIDPTRALVDAIRRVQRKPATLVNASAVGYYGPVEEGEVTESWPRGEGFLAETGEKWEQEAIAASELGVRVVVARNGVVLDKGALALAKMTLPFKLFVGGPVGSGRQWFPWIHRKDLVAVVDHLLKTPSLSGPVNTTAPGSVTMEQFSTELGKALHRPSWMPVPGFALKVIFGELSSMLLTGQRVVPAKLEESGFAFRYPNVREALQDIFE